MTTTTANGRSEDHEAQFQSFPPLPSYNEVVIDPNQLQFRDNSDIFGGDFEKKTDFNDSKNATDGFSHRNETKVICFRGKFYETAAAIGGKSLKSLFSFNALVNFVLSIVLMIASMDFFKSSFLITWLPAFSSAYLLFYVLTQEKSWVAFEDLPVVNFFGVIASSLLLLFRAQPANDMFLVVVIIHNLYGYVLTSIVCSYFRTGYCWFFRQVDDKTVPKVLEDKDFFFFHELFRCNEENRLKQVIGLVQGTVYLIISSFLFITDLHATTYMILLYTIYELPAFYNLRDRNYCHCMILVCIGIVLVTLFQLAFNLISFMGMSYNVWKYWAFITGCLATLNSLYYCTYILHPKIVETTEEFAR